MKALFKKGAGTGTAVLKDIPEPRCGDDEVKIEVKACGVCGTDIHIIHDLYPWSDTVVLGHEYSGVVVEAGRNVTTFQPGDRVTGSGSGGFARYLVVNPARNEFLFKLPECISFEEGALFEPLSASVHGVLDQSGIKAMDVVLVSGPGTIGINAMQMAKIMGAVVILVGTSVDGKRLELARKLGADVTLNAQEQSVEEQVAQMTGGRGVDAVLECSGAQAALDTGLKVLKNGGKITQLGLFSKHVSLDLDSMVYRGLQMATSIGYVRDSWTRSIAMVEHGRLDVKSLISHQLPLSQWETAFGYCEKKEGFKILILPD
jgi:L-iditol 2-dehydrogenase